MALGDISKIMGDNDSVAKIPDLDWASIDLESKDNIPVPMNVEIVPQLVESWTYTGKDKTANIIPNHTSSAHKIEKISSEDVKGVLNSAKKEIMTGLSGKALAQKLSSTYPPKLIKAAANELQKLAEEQGLLGNVYVDLSPFDSCKDAARSLGANKIRLAKYVVGMPKRHVCASHHQGICKELKKKVVASIEYDEETLLEYTDHLRVAGLLDAQDNLTSKEDLRAALLYKGENKTAKTKKEKNLPSKTFEEVQKAFSSEISKKTAAIQEEIRVDRFSEVRPVLAFMQNEMLKGHMGESLKEAIQSRYTEDVIKAYAPEIKKLASLQGLLGNVYVDVSLYSDAEEAIHSIKNASTSPSYVIQTVKANEFDNLAEKVAKSTGCLTLPRDGKIDIKIASSYIDDLQFNDRISAEKANVLRGTLEASENVLGTLREAFISTQDYKPAKREGGVKGYYRQETGNKYDSRDNVKEAAYKAVTAGVAIDKVESKLSTLIPTAEAAGMVRDVLANVKEVDANVLSNCTTEKYHFSPEARIKEASKCSSCILKNCDMCMSQGIKFASAKEDVEDVIKLDANTKKVLLNENPDVVRDDMSLEKDLADSRWGSGNNIMLDTLSKQANQEVDNSFSNDGLDAGLADI